MSLSHLYEAVEIGLWSYPLGTGDNGSYVFRSKLTGRSPNEAWPTTGAAVKGKERLSLCPVKPGAYLL